MDQKAHGPAQEPVAACWTAVKEHRALPDDWFPRSGPLKKYNIEALRICRQECPLRAECLTWAMQRSRSQYGLYGIWGGSMPLERKRIARRAA